MSPTDPPTPPAATAAATDPPAATVAATDPPAATVAADTARDGGAVSAGRRALGVALAITAGGLLACQARVNGELGSRIGDGVFAALVSFGGGLAVLVVMTTAIPSTRHGLRRLADTLRRRELRWWQTIGGLAGAALVASQGVTVASIGVAVFTVAAVAGQSATGLAVDRAGLGPGGRRPVTAVRVLAAVGMIAAVLVAVADRLAAPALLALAVLPLLAGAGLSWQAAVNGRVGAAARSPLTAALVNFTVGTAALAVVSAVVVAVRGAPGPFPGEWWLYVGGTFGIPVITMSVAAVRWVGVLLLGFAMTAGQVAAALVLDLVTPAGDHVTVTTVVGCALALAVVAVAAVSTRDTGPMRG